MQSAGTVDRDAVLGSANRQQHAGDPRREHPWRPTIELTKDRLICFRASDRTPLQASPIDDPDGYGLEASMVRWLRDHSSGMFREPDFEQWMRTSIETLRAAIAATAV